MCFAPVQTCSYTRGFQIFNKCFFFSGPSSIKRLPEAKEAGGSDPGAGGPLAGVLPVHSEFCGYDIKHAYDECKYGLSVHASMILIQHKCVKAPLQNKTLIYYRDMYL